MDSAWSNVVRACGGVSCALAAACGGDGGGTPPVTVASVVVSAPVNSFQTLGRTAQFTAQPKDAAGGNVAVGVTWSSSNALVASVSATGLVTAVANGTAGITATASGTASTAATVTVFQVPAQIIASPNPVVFGAIGSQRTIIAAVADSGGSIVGLVGPPTFTRAGPGTTATVSAGGLVTAQAVGTGDTAVATAGAIERKVPITVTQVVASVVVTSASPTPDTLFTTGRTRLYSAAPRDSNGNAIGGPAITWNTNASVVATVNSAGLVMAVADGNANISATISGVNGIRAVVVRRFPATLTITPPSTTITTAAGTQLFNGVAQDSAGSTLVIAWSSKNAGVASVSPSGGASTTATAVGDGTTFVVAAAGTRRDSAQVDVSNQPGISFAAQVQPIFNTSCAVTGCHTGPTPTGPGLNLSAASSYANLVGVASVGMPGAIRVIAGDPDASYLIRKLEGGPNIAGSRMPDGGAALPPATIQLIRTWILQGAANN